MVSMTCFLVVGDASLHLASIFSSAGFTAPFPTVCAQNSSSLKPNSVLLGLDAMLAFLNAFNTWIK